jgi:hypothetical protein
MQGVQGQFITLDPDYAPEDAYDRLRGARFIIDNEIGEDGCYVLVDFLS